MGRLKHREFNQQLCLWFLFLPTAQLSAVPCSWYVHVRVCMLSCLCCVCVCLVHGGVLVFGCVLEFVCLVCVSVCRCVYIWVHWCMCVGVFGVRVYIGVSMCAYVLGYVSVCVVCVRYVGILLVCLCVGVYMCWCVYVGVPECCVCVLICVCLFVSVCMESMNYCM